MIYPGLDGANVVLLGGHSNIGQHVTQLFAASGAHVLIGARDLDRAEEVAKRAAPADTGSVDIIHVDATSWDSVRALVEKALERGPIDVFYHGVGWDVFGHFLDLDPALWDEIYERNFRSVMSAYKIVLPGMKDARKGCFISMSSVMGRRPTPIEPVYGALKAGLIHLAQTLALELGEYGVRINVVAPGPTPPTDVSSISANSTFHGFMADPAGFENTSKALASEIPLKRTGSPENVAHAVLYLASPVTGGFQTGQVLGVDGGWWMPK